jgi:hypothetical protein
VSYDPRLPEHLQLFVKRVIRDDDFIKQTEDEIVAFLLELEQKIEALEALK